MIASRPTRRFVPGIGIARSISQASRSRSFAIASARTSSGVRISGLRAAVSGIMENIPPRAAIEQARPVDGPIAMHSGCRRDRWHPRSDPDDTIRESDDLSTNSLRSTAMTARVSDADE